jgi:hypothetical protein
MTSSSWAIRAKTEVSAGLSEANVEWIYDDKEMVPSKLAFRTASWFRKTWRKGPEAADYWEQDVVQEGLLPFRIGQADEANGDFCDLP